MIWKELYINENGSTVYQRIDDDGKVRITAIRGYPELDNWLAWIEAGNKEEDFWTQERSI